ncbi:hypothetical protein TTHERM_00138580 (macronuclear) [Tetrahymena thermophila SB210]|uniref:Uncharacterized protein n=1 Tax=Tetrahymena thermophila (strain SB210) TaxID=312017 RepID=I7LVR9_TETTS|nr:hypothetical protein TTHERM_00138580 [Tetrahymena thermophila SB210]EAR99595.2 hypothetical protein TTHERM_00138580 [Tetrahymena thermophila SB210]|eukprot:XP_001019840.2 hypothetical protein TTHERM_00138580 [Tetrahymena thermophila SB210]
MKKIVDQPSENYYSPYSHNSSPTPKIERIKLNTLLQNQDNQPTPINQIGLIQQISQHSQTQFQHKQNQNYPNLLDDLLQSANLGGVVLNFENPIVFNDTINEENSKMIGTGQIQSPNGTIYKQSLKDYRIKQHQLKKSNQMAKRIQKKFDNRPKIFVNKSTDTTEDLRIARLQYDRIEKENMLSQIQKETEENIQEITKYLKSTTEIKLNFSGVSSSIKEVAKALQKKKFDTDQMLARENVRDEELGDLEEELNQIKEYLESEFVDVQKETAHKILEFVNRVLKERKAIPEKTSNSKKQKGNKEKTQVKKDQEIQSLRERVGYLENKVEENINELDKKQDEVKDLKFQVDFKDKDINKLNNEINYTKDELNKAEVDKKSLYTQIEKSKNQQDKLAEQKIQEEKQREKIQQKLKKTEDRVIDIERENYMLRDEIMRISQLTKNVDEQEKMNMQVLCQMVMDSGMSAEDQKRALMKIQQLYLESSNGNGEINQERQRYIQQMMNQFKSNNVKTFEELEQMNQRSKQSLSKLSQQEISDKENPNQKNKKAAKLSNKSSLTNIEEEQTEVTYRKEKRIVKQKVIKTVMQKKKIIDENGQEIEIEEPIQVESEEEVEIEVDIPVVKQKNQKNQNSNATASNKNDQKKTDKVTKNTSNNQSNAPSASDSRRPSNRGQINLNNQINQKNMAINNNSNSSLNTPKKKQFQSGRNSFAVEEKIAENQLINKQNPQQKEIQKSDSVQLSNREKPKPVVLKLFEGNQQLGDNVFMNEDDFFEEVEKEIEEQDGFEEIEEQVVDEHGNVMVVKKTVPKMVKKTIKIKKKLSNVDDLEVVEQEHEIEETVVDPITGQQKIIKKKVLRKVAVPKSKLDQNYEFVDQEQTVEELVFDPETGQSKVIQKKITKKIAIPKTQLDNYKIQEKEVEIEETIINPETGQPQVVKKKVIQKIAQRIDDENILNNSFGQNSNRDTPQNGQMKPKKKQIRQVMVEQEIEVLEEEEIIDENGNKQKVQRVVKKKQMVPKFEEIEVDDFEDTNNPQKSRTNLNSNKNNNAHDFSVQSTQTDQFLLWPIVEALLYELDVDPSKIEGIQQKYFNENSPQGANGISLNLMDLANQLQERKQQFQQRQKEKQEQEQELERVQKQQYELSQKQNQASQDMFNRNEDELLMLNEISPIKYDKNGKILEDDDEIDEKQIEILDDKHLLAESTIKKIFLKLQQRDNKGALQIKELIRKYYNKPKNSQISYDEFKHFYIKVLTIHQRCGDQCPHLARFFSKIGFKTNKYGNRREIKPTKQKLNPFIEQQNKSSSATPQNKTAIGNSNSNSISKNSFSQAIQNKTSPNHYMTDSPKTPYRSQNQNSVNNLTGSTTKLPKISKDSVISSYSGFKQNSIF